MILGIIISTQYHKLGVLGYRGIAGNKAADANAKDAAERRIPDKDSPPLAVESICTSFLKNRAAERRQHAAGMRIQ